MDKESDVTCVADKVDDVKDANKIPQYVEDTISQIKSNKGGKLYKNKPLNGEELLPNGITYKEYDVHPYQKGYQEERKELL